MIVGFIGDTDSSLAEEAKKYCTSAVFIDQQISPLPPTFYTSVGDTINFKSFLDIIESADVLYYCPPKEWSSEATKEHTEIALEYALCIGKRVLGYEVETDLDTKVLLPSALQITDVRKSIAPQLWIVGCSIAHGIGVLPHQRFGELIQTNLKLEISWLTKPGSSVTWASDQIVRSSISTGDIVCWAITSPNRTEYYDGNDLIQILPSMYDKNKKLQSMVPIDELDGSNIDYQCAIAIERAKNHCAKVGAKLAILPVFNDYQNPLISALLGNKISKRKHTLYVDYGSDDQHPGPLQHKVFAKTFLSLLK